MRRILRITVSLAALGWFLAPGPAPAMAGESPGHVLDAAGIAARIDRKLDMADADRRVLEDFLARPDVREIAGTAGIDLGRASASMATLSDAERHDLAGRASSIVNEAGAGKSVTISVAAVVIIILLIILL